LSGLNPLFARVSTAVLLLAFSACSLSATKGVESEKKDKTPDFRIAVVGDTMLDASAAQVMKREGYDYAFAGSAPLYADSEIVLANLEGPLTSRGDKADKKYTFRSPAAVATALKAAGINAVTLANNHSLDYGEPGLSDTIKALKASGIGYFGAGENRHAAREALIMKVGGVRIGMLGYSLTFPEEFWAGESRAGTAFGHRQWIIDDVTALKKRVDLVLVSFHWGQEGKTKLRSYQPLLAHAAIDAGADVVIGHHPHIAQGIERYRGRAIIYSLGNYVFGSYSNRVQYGLVGVFTVHDKKISELKLMPVDVNNFRVQFRPVALKGEPLATAVKQLQTLSLQRGTTLQQEGDQLRLPLPGPAPAEQQAGETKAGEEKAGE